MTNPEFWTSSLIGDRSGLLYLQILKRYPTDRLSLPKIMNHPWIQRFANKAITQSLKNRRTP